MFARTWPKHLHCSTQWASITGSTTHALYLRQATSFLLPCQDRLPRIPPINQIAGSSGRLADSLPLSAASPAINRSITTGNRAARLPISPSRQLHYYHTPLHVFCQVKLQSLKASPFSSCFSFLGTRKALARKPVPVPNRPTTRRHDNDADHPPAHSSRMDWFVNERLSLCTRQRESPSGSLA